MKSQKTITPKKGDPHKPSTILELRSRFEASTFDYAVEDGFFVVHNKLTSPTCIPLDLSSKDGEARKHLSVQIATVIRSIRWKHFGKRGAEPLTLYTSNGHWNSRVSKLIKSWEYPIKKLLTLGENWDDFLQHLRDNGCKSRITEFNIETLASVVTYSVDFEPSPYLPTTQQVVALKTPQKAVVETPTPEADPLHEPGFDTHRFLLFAETVDEGNSDCLEPDQLQFYEQNKWRIGL